MESYRTPQVDGRSFCGFSCSLGMQNLSVTESLEDEHEILSTLLAVLEFENGSREEELFVVFMSQGGNFWMFGVACMVLRAVGLIC